MTDVPLFDIVGVLGWCVLSWVGIRLCDMLSCYVDEVV